MIDNAWHPAKRLAALTALGTVVVLSGHIGAARSAAPEPPAQPASGKAPLDTIIVEAQRRKQLEQEVNHFVSSVVVRYWSDSLLRWNTPVCPLVAGLPREQGELVLARISQIARNAHAPLAGEKCGANFLVVATSKPDELLEKWWKRIPDMYDTKNGVLPLERFLGARRPIRVWYNSFLGTSSSGARLSPDLFAQLLQGPEYQGLQGTPSSESDGSRLEYSAVQSISSVIIVVDKNRMTGINLRQIADYVAMIGLAEVRVDADTGSIPTILDLFRDTRPLPEGLSAWDEAYLASLYDTTQASIVQVSQMKKSVLNQIAPQRH